MASPRLRYGRVTPIRPSRGRPGVFQTPLIHRAADPRHPAPTA
jgi:hypothetical protein